MVLQSFIVFEGLDGSGTSTQLKLLQEKLVTKNVWFTAEPTDKETGLFLRKMLKGEIKINPQTTAFMFATDRCEHLNGKDGVISHIEDGNLVISDRYLFSSLAYQNQECGKELPYNLNKDFPLPEYLFFFDMDPEKSLERVIARANKTGEQTEIYEKLEFQKKTYQEYKNVIEFYSKPEFSDMKIVIIDASKSIQEIHEKILSIIKDLPILKV